MRFFKILLDVSPNFQFLGPKIVINYPFEVICFDLKSLVMALKRF